MPLICFSNSIFSTSHIDRMNLKIPYAGIHDVVWIQRPFQFLHELIMMLGPVFGHHSGAPALMAIRIPPFRTCKFGSFGEEVLHNLLRTFVFSSDPQDSRDYPTGRERRNNALVRAVWDTFLLEPVINKLGRRVMTILHLGARHIILKECKRTQ